MSFTGAFQDCEGRDLKCGTCFVSGMNSRTGVVADDVNVEKCFLE